MIVLETSGVLAAIDADQPRHEAAMAALQKASPPRLLSPFVLAELDDLVQKRVGQEQGLRLLAEVARGAYQLEPFAAADVDEAAGVIRRHTDLRLGLADASVVVLARRHKTRNVLTLDERNFRAVRAYGGKPFRLWPADVR